MQQALGSAGAAGGALWPVRHRGKNEAALVLPTPASCLMHFVQGGCSKSLPDLKQRKHPPRCNVTLSPQSCGTCLSSIPWVLLPGDSPQGLSSVLTMKDALSRL